MSYDGYKFISCALVYQTIITPLKAYVYISITWSIAIMLSLLPLFGWSRYAYKYRSMHLYCRLGETERL